MRKKFVAANWKMNTDLNDGIKLAESIASEFKDYKEKRVALAVPFTHLYSISTILKGTNIELCAQNINENLKGAFTGEISSSMLKSVRATIVIIGHSERRTIYNENYTIIHNKMKTALSEGFDIILCIGESKEERENGMLEKVLTDEITTALFDVSKTDLKKITIAYEPIWAIGTGLTATPDDANNAHKFIRSVIEKLYSKTEAEDISILYGGSVNENNASSLFKMSDIDGGLIGGASLVSDKFKVIVKA